MFVYSWFTAVHAHTAGHHMEPESTTAGILSPAAGKQQKNIHSRLGPKAEVSSTTGSPNVISTKSGTSMPLGHRKK